MFDLPTGAARRRPTSARLDALRREVRNLRQSLRRVPPSTEAAADLRVRLSIRGRELCEEHARVGTPPVPGEGARPDGAGSRV